MVVKVWALAALLVAGLFAGCTSAPAAFQERSRPAQQDAVEALGGALQAPVAAQADAAAPGAPPANATAPAVGLFQAVPEGEGNGTWALAAMRLQPDAAALAGFRWTVPEGAVHKGRYGLSGVNLEVAFLLPKGAAVDNYTVSFFTFEDGVPRLTELILGEPVAAVERITPALSQPLSLEVSFDPTFVFFDDDTLAEGDSLGIVLEAQGTASAFGLAWRVLDHSVYFTDEEPAGSTAQFLRSVQGPAVALAPIATGTGFQGTAYLDLHLDALIGLELRVGPVRVDDRLATEALRPTATARDVTLSSAFANEGPGGWGLALAAYLGSSGAAQWSLAGDVHGVPVQESGVALGAGVAALPAVVLVGGKEGPSSSLDFVLQVADSGEVSLLVLEAFDYGTPVSALLGSKAPEGVAVQTLQAAQPDAQPRALGRDLVLPSVGGVTVQLPGAASLLRTA